MDLFEYLSESRAQKAAERQRQQDRAAAARDQILGGLRRSWPLLVAGMLALVGIGCLASISSSGSFGAGLLDLVGGLAFLAASAFCGYLVLRAQRRKAAQKKYLAILAGIDSIRIQEIAAKTNHDQATVVRDVQQMIDEGVVEDVYVDHTTDRVVRRHPRPVAPGGVVTCRACGTSNPAATGGASTCVACGEPLTAS